MRTLSALMLLLMFVHASNGLNPCSSAKMWGAYNEMKAANCRNCDRYFHCIGNYRAVYQCTGPLRRSTASFISNMREWTDGFRDSGNNSAEDQKANNHGRHGRDCGIYLRNVGCAYRPSNKKCHW
ncbi:putative Serum amyloid A-1 protein [Daphnia magna]|uniref:Putative Serum amyloid A-1 protein n=1 Tax=Daphnia magna TaxID=35525 RepID=A0A0P5HJU7_9CRUS|nr:putative Serum amyloid A-1 protein [Daphnia magna]